jgi:hypothetical protein
MFALGTLHLPAGRHQLAVKASFVPNNLIMNLNEVVLTKTP